MKFLKLWLPVFIWGGAIFYFSSIPNLTTGWGFWDFILRKFTHITEYFILTFLLYRAFKNSFRLSSFYLIFLLAVFSLLYAISDEIHQAFVPLRGPSALDVLIDSCGIIIFFMLLKVKRKNISCYGEN